MQVLWRTASLSGLAPKFGDVSQFAAFPDSLLVSLGRHGVEVDSIDGDTNPTNGYESKRRIASGSR